MSEDSPLFVSAMELMAHSIELYADGNSKKYKFVILHLANAVELILKDKVLDTGQTIYKDNNKETIGIWQCFKALESKGVVVPERPIIELLIDDRNTIQHRFGFPNSESVFYYLQKTLSFFKRFLREEYDQSLAEVLALHTSESNLELVGVLDQDQARSQVLEKLFSISPESAALQAYSMLEEKWSPLLSGKNRKGKPPVMLWHHEDFKPKMEKMAAEGFLPEDAAEKFAFLRNARNMAAHSQHFEASPASHWRTAVDYAVELINGVEKAEAEGFFNDNEAPSE